MENRSKGGPGSLSSSRSKSKRSSTNLANLRLTPLSSKYTDPNQGSDDTAEQSSDVTFSTSHPSYLQGKSAPTTPGILSRSSSRRQLHSLRRISIYDNEDAELNDHEVSTVAREGTGAGGLQARDPRLPKAKSEAALPVQTPRVMQKPGQTNPQGRRRHHSRRATGTSSPTITRTSTKSRDAEDDWITRTGVTANVIVQESKGQSWMTSKSSTTSLAQLQNSTEDDDEGYEEMAAMSASTMRDAGVDGDLTPVNTRVVGWGSRYGSRAGSRRTSRRGSFSGSRTTLGPMTSHEATGQALDEYVTTAMEPDFVDSEDELSEQGDATVSGIVGSRSFGFGGVVDRLMNLNLFKVEEKEESTDDEWGHLGETDAQAAERMAADSRRKREEKEKLLNRGVSGGAEQQEEPPEGGWSDVAFLVSVASKVLF